MKQVRMTKAGSKQTNFREGELFWVKESEINHLGVTTKLYSGGKTIRHKWSIAGVADNTADEATLEFV